MIFKLVKVLNLIFWNSLAKFLDWSFDIVDIKNFAGESPLHVASRVGDERVLTYLLEHKAFVNIKNNQGETPLFYAVRAQNKGSINLLLKYQSIPTILCLYIQCAYAKSLQLCLTL